MSNCFVIIMSVKLNNRLINYNNPDISIYTLGHYDKCCTSSEHKEIFVGIL